MPTGEAFYAHLGRDAPQALLPVYVLLCPSPLLLQEAYKALRVAVLQADAPTPAAPTATDTATHSLNAESFSLQDGTATASTHCLRSALQAARDLPLFAPRAQSKRFIHLRDVQALPASAHADLLAYWQRPVSATVLCCSASKLDGRSKLGQFCNKAAFCFTFEPPRGNACVAWLQRRAQHLGVELEYAAAQQLHLLCGDDLHLLLETLQKVQLYAAGTPCLSVADVQAITAPTRQANIFAFTDALGERQFATASLLCERLLQSVASPLLLLSMIHRQLRQLLIVKSANPACTPAALATQLQVRPFVVDTLQKQAARFAYQELLDALQATTQADIQLKSSRLSPQTILDGLLLQISG